MRAPLRWLLLLPAVAAAAGAACGSTGGPGGAATTSASSSTSASTTGSTSGATSTSTSTSPTTSSTSTTTTTTSASSMLLCGDSQDMAILTGTLTWPAEVSCSGQDGSDAGALQACITAATGLTPPCAACIAEDLECAAPCQSACAGAPASHACYECRQANCALSFAVCSGLANETGSFDCAALYGDGPVLTSWITGLWETFFTTAAGYAAYQSYDACVCGTCTACQIHYCGGNQIASPPCVDCIQQQCAGPVADCQAN